MQSLYVMLLIFCITIEAAEGSSNRALMVAVTAVGVGLGAVCGVKAAKLRMADSQSSSQQEKEHTAQTPVANKTIFSGLWFYEEHEGVLHEALANNQNVDAIVKAREHGSTPLHQLFRFWDPERNVTSYDPVDELAGMGDYSLEERRRAPLGEFLRIGRLKPRNTDRERCVRELLARNANVNAQDSNGATPLHLAIENFHQNKHTSLNAVKLLVAAQADLTTRTEWCRRTPVDYAHENRVHKYRLLRALHPNRPLFEVLLPQDREYIEKLNPPAPHVMRPPLMNFLNAVLDHRIAEIPSMIGMIVEYLCESEPQSVPEKKDEQNEETAKSTNCQP